MTKYRLPSEQIRQIDDSIFERIDGLEVQVRLYGKREHISAEYLHVLPLWGKLAVTVFQEGQGVYYDGSVQVKLPHSLHKYNVTWEFVTERAHRLAHDAVEKVRQNMWEALIK